jgi:hypothetical protein
VGFWAPEGALSVCVGGDGLVSGHEHGKKGRKKRDGGLCHSHAHVA